MSATTQNGNDTFQEHLARRARPAPKMRVLAVDDDASILELLKTALTALGSCDVSIASSGAEAMRQIERQTKPFDCMLLDIQMPEQNGISLCKAIRELPGHSETPIIMLTAMSERSYVDQAFAAGATDYVTKPFDFLELKSRIASAQKLVVEHRRANESLAIAQRLKEELENNQHVAFDDPISVNNANRLIGFTEFDNYVAQLSRGKLFYSYVTAVRIASARQFHGGSSSSEFRDALEDVGKAISQVTKRAERIISYRGSGLFLCVCHGANAPVLKDTETKLNQLVATFQAQRGSQSRISVLVGDRVPMRSISRSGAMQSMASAIDSVDAIEATNQDIAPPTSHVADRAGSPARQARMDRRAYERALRELMSDEPSLSTY